MLLHCRKYRPQILLPNSKAVLPVWISSVITPVPVQLVKSGSGETARWHRKLFHIMPARTAVSNDMLNAPLIVLDGIPYGGSINDINPDDIANLDILKDASATAIYGSRGSGGVILITTKRGNKSGKAVMSYNGYYGIIQYNR